MHSISFNPGALVRSLTKLHPRNVWEMNIRLKHFTNCVKTFFLCIQKIQKCEYKKCGIHCLACSKGKSSFEVILL